MNYDELTHEEMASLADALRNERFAGVTPERAAAIEVALASIDESARKRPQLITGYARNGV